MDIQDLRIFARVARVQNLTAVGAELELSAGTISKRLQALEAELAIRLFDRTTRSIRITDEGARLLDEVESILGQLDDALANVTAHVAQPRGRLRISAPVSLGRGVIAPAACAFMKAYGEIELQVDLTDRVVGLPDGGYDVAIRTGELADSSLVAKRLAPDPQIIVAAPSYLKQRGTPRQPEDLAHHSCLMLGEGQQWRLVRNGTPCDVKVAGRLRSDNGELLRYAALEGLGILRVSTSRVVDELKKGLLCRLLDDWDAGGQSAVWAVYPSSRHVLPKLRVFLEFMATWFRDDRTLMPWSMANGSRYELEEILARLSHPVEKRRRRGRKK
jgi:DNA-binding transcriptional LysR family regulator